MIRQQEIAIAQIKWKRKITIFKGRKAPTSFRRPSALVDE